MHPYTKTLKISELRSTPEGHIWAKYSNGDSHYHKKIGTIEDLTSGLKLEAQVPPRERPSEPEISITDRAAVALDSLLWRFLP